MKNKIIATIGNVNHGCTTLGTAVKSVLEREKLNLETIREQGDKVYEFENFNKKTIDAISPSKTRLKKCKKGLHEFTKTDFVENNIPKWSCRYCGVFMNNR
jgi:rubrerythrin